MELEVTVAERVRYDFTKNEIDEMGRNLAAVNRGIKEVADNIKQLKATQKDLENKAQRMVDGINSGWEIRVENCPVQYNTPEPGKKTITNPNTGEIVRVEAMKQHEMQHEMFDAK